MHIIKYIENKFVNASVADKIREKEELGILSTIIKDKQIIFSDQLYFLDHFHGWTVFTCFIKCFLRFLNTRIFNFVSKLQIGQTNKLTVKKLSKQNLKKLCNYLYIKVRVCTSLPLT